MTPAYAIARLENTISRLRAAAERIAQPRCWRKHKCASDAEGNPVPPHSEPAAEWYATVTLRAVLPDTRDNPEYIQVESDALELLCFALPEPEADAKAKSGCAHWRRRVAAYNDLPDTSHYNILELYSRAVSIAERRLAILGRVVILGI